MLLWQRIVGILISIVPSLVLLILGPAYHLEFNHVSIIALTSEAIPLPPACLLRGASSPWKPVLWGSWNSWKPCPDTRPGAPPPSGCSRGPHLCHPRHRPLRRPLHQ